jgi:hypothetical protein
VKHIWLDIALFNEQLRGLTRHTLKHSSLKKEKTFILLFQGNKKSIAIRGFKPSAGTKVSVIGVKGNLPFRISGADFIIDLSSIKPGDINPDLFVVKLSNAL